jgi:hypothetical protein
MSLRNDVVGRKGPEAGTPKAPGFDSPVARQEKPIDTKMKDTSEDMAMRSLKLVCGSIDRQRADIEVVLKQVEKSHDEYELLHYGVYRALLAYNHHLEQAKEDIVKLINQ